MAKYLDKTLDEWKNIVEQWHNDESITISLADYMQLNEVEYTRFVHNITDADLSDEEVYEEAAKRVRTAVVGLTIGEMFGM